MAFYEFGKKIGVSYEKQSHFNAYIEYARSSGWLYAYKGVAFVSDRPTVIKKDADNALHCEDGPAIAFTDGYAVYAWRGTNIPSQWVGDRASLTPQLALTWENVDQRAVACEILGWHHIINTLNARVLDEDPDPQIGRLVEVDLPDHGPQKFIHATCGTGREIAVMADANAKTIIEAQAASYGLTASDFHVPEVRT